MAGVAARVFAVAAAAACLLLRLQLLLRSPLSVVLFLGTPQLNLFFIPFALVLFLSILPLVFLLLLSFPLFLFLFISFIPTFFLFIFVGIVFLLVALLVLFFLFFSFVLLVRLFSVSVRPAPFSLAVAFRPVLVCLAVSLRPITVSWAVSFRPFAFLFRPFASLFWPLAASPVVFVLVAGGNGGSPSQVVEAVPVAGVGLLDSLEVLVLVDSLEVLVLVVPRFIAVENTEFVRWCPGRTASPPQDVSTSRAVVATTLQASSSLGGDKAGGRHCPRLPWASSEFGDLRPDNLLRPV